MHVLTLWRSAIIWQINSTICVHFYSSISSLGYRVVNLFYNLYTFSQFHFLFGLELILLQPKQEIELSTCGKTFVLIPCHFCQLITDLCKWRTLLKFLTSLCLFVVCLFFVFDIRSFPLQILPSSAKPKLQFCWLAEIAL